MAMHSQVTKKPVYKPAVIGFGLIILSILVAMSGPLGSRIGWWSYDFAIDILKWSAYGGIVAAVLCLSGLVAARPGGKRRGFVFSLLGLTIIVPMLLLLQSWKEAELSSPPIHDISTNTENPPAFWSAPNTQTYDSGIAVWQEQAYPDIQPLVLPVSTDKALDLSIGIIRDRGWKLWKPDREEKHVEATATTFWFGFNDDVVIHITAIGENSSRIDMRSTSRFGGGGDGGTNAKRIRLFLKALKERSRK